VNQGPREATSTHSASFAWRAALRVVDDDRYALGPGRTTERCRFRTLHPALDPDSLGVYASQ